jgi:hypothetical protein
LGDAGKWIPAVAGMTMFSFRALRVFRGEVVLGIRAVA